MTIKNKVAIITGASSGIGYATALALSKAGVKVVIGARRTDKLEQLENEIKKNGGEVLSQKLDVTKKTDCDAIVDQTIKKWGTVDIIDFVLLTIYPVGALFIIEILSRIISRTARPVPSWLKLIIQGITMVGFAVTYTAFMPFLINQDAYTVEPHAITAFCLVALAVALFYQARRAKINPKKSLY